MLIKSRGLSRGIFTAREKEKRLLSNPRCRSKMKFAMTAKERPGFMEAMGRKRGKRR